MHLPPLVSEGQPFLKMDAQDIQNYLKIFFQSRREWASYTVEERISNQENWAVHRRESTTQRESVAHAKLRHTWAPNTV